MKTVQLYTQTIEINEDAKVIRIAPQKRCTVIDNKVYSYDTEVATIDWATKTLFVPKSSFSYSKTTTNHLGEVTKMFKLSLFGKRPQVKIKDYTHSTW